MEVPFIQEMQHDEQFGWLYIWQPKNVENHRPRFFGGYEAGTYPGASLQHYECEGGVLKSVFNDMNGAGNARLQIYEVSGPIISRLPRLLHVYESTFGAI